MTDIYQSWIGEFGIDGFRIDTMKHVNDEFWQAFGPGILDYADRHGKPDFFMFGEVALDGSDAAAKSLTSHYTTHDGMQAILDFPFQDAARGFASKRLPTQRLADFFANDDWYTDADSNAYSLPTFLGNHDMGRFGYFVTTDNTTKGQTADAAELLDARPARPRADVPLPRQPGRLLRRRAGLHRHRRRPARAPDDVRQPGAGVPGRHPDRHRPHGRRRQLRHRATRSTGRSATSPRSPTGIRPCATAPSRCGSRPTPPACSPSRGSTGSASASTSSCSTTASRPRRAPCRRTCARAGSPGSTAPARHT